ncbi:MULTISPECIES: DUF7683 domain-containing protein [Streptomyces]|uniref:DUF7683 domain-containing protein n=1 Tax=Streptomyces TaxID=1883 RepID=UPI00292D2D96|nr:hypothetical protein [Streptomyces sp. NEAU-HV9]
MSTEEPDLAWVLEGYSKADDTLRTQHPISREQILRLREVIRPDMDDPWMVHSYPVSDELWPAVNAILRCGRPHPELEYLTGAYEDR